jgi:single-stranded-DNA-specific exonuclease
MGLDVLLQEAGVKKEAVSEESIGFTIAPRLNALGRLGEAAPGVESSLNHLKAHFDKRSIFIG